MSRRVWARRDLEYRARAQGPRGIRGTAWEPGGTTRPGTEWEPGRLAGPTVRSSASHPARSTAFHAQSLSPPRPPSSEACLGPHPHSSRDPASRPYPIGSPPLPQAPPQPLWLLPRLNFEGQPSHPMNSRDAGVGGRRANPEGARAGKAGLRDGRGGGARLFGCQLPPLARLLHCHWARSRRRGRGARARGPGGSSARSLGSPCLHLEGPAHLAVRSYRPRSPAPASRR